MKYARPVDCSMPKAGENIRMTDVIEIPNGQDAETWLTTMFDGLKAQWQAAGEWFVQVWDGVEPSQQYFGGDYMSPAGYIDPNT